MLSLKQLAFLWAIQPHAVTYRAKKGTIPGAVSTGEGRRTRWAFPDEAAELIATAPKREQPGRPKTTCAHCRRIFTSAKTYGFHRKAVSINGRTTTACMDETEMKLRGLMKNDRGEWKRRPAPEGRRGPATPPDRRPEAD